MINLKGTITKSKNLSGYIVPGSRTGGTNNYDLLENKPSINNIELIGNKSLEELGIQPKGDYITNDTLENYVTEEELHDYKPEYTADDIIFKNNLVLTAPIGVHTIPSSGSKTLETIGKSVRQVFDMLIAEEKNPSISQPSVSINLNGSGAKEAGTIFTPMYSCTLNKGSYQYGPDTRVVANSWSITDTNSNRSTTQTGSFSQFQVEDGTNYHISVTVQHSAGSVPKTNLGNDYPVGAIQEGSKSSNSSSVTSYRNCFYGTTVNKNALDSQTIRSLNGKSNREATNGSMYNISVPVGALRVVIAYKSTLRDITSALDVNGLNAQIVGSFKKQIIQVEGANAYEPIEYKVFTLEFANPNDTANTIKITI